MSWGGFVIGVMANILKTCAFQSMWILLKSHKWILNWDHVSTENFKGKAHGSGQLTMKYIKNKMVWWMYSRIDGLCVRRQIEKIVEV